MPLCPQCENQVPSILLFKAPYYGGKTIDGDIVTFCAVCRKWYKWTWQSTLAFSLSWLGLSAAAGALIVGFGLWVAQEFGVDQENEWLLMLLFFAILITSLYVSKLLSRLIVLESLSNEQSTGNQ